MKFIITIDIVQQGGSSGSPIFGPDNRRVVGMMYGGINDVSEGISGPTRFLYTIPTNISLAEPAYIIVQALAEYLKQAPAPKGPIPTLKELTGAQPKPIDSTGVPWDILPPT
jgi:hypothetical protein